MIVESQNSPFRDLKKVKDRDVGARVARLVDSARVAQTMGHLTDIKPMTDRPGYYRFRVSNYRVGVFIEGE